MVRRHWRPRRDNSIEMEEVSERIERKKSTESAQGRPNNAPQETVNSTKNLVVSVGKRNGGSFTGEEKLSVLVGFVMLLLVIMSWGGFIWAELKSSSSAAKRNDSFHNKSV